MLSELPVFYGGYYHLNDPSYQVGLIIMTWISILVLVGPALLSAAMILRAERKERSLIRGGSHEVVEIGSKRTEKSENKVA